MTRDPRVRRAQVLAGIIVGVIVGTAHALVTHIVSRTAEPAVTVTLEAGLEHRGHDDGTR